MFIWNGTFILVEKFLADRTCIRFKKSGFQSKINIFKFFNLFLFVFKIVATQDYKRSTQGIE